MKLRRLISESRIDATREQLFDFFADPNTLRRIAPPRERLQIIRHWNALRVGAKTSYIVFGGILPARWDLEVVVIEQGRMIAETMTSGPFEAWRHETQFIREGRNSTLLRDVVKYRLPWGLPGLLLNERRVRARMRKWFSDQHDAVLKLVAGRTYDMVGLATRPLNPSQCSTALVPADPIWPSPVAPPIFVAATNGVGPLFAEWN